MANKRVSIWKYVKIAGRWRYCRPAQSPNGRIKPDVVIVNDSHQYHPEGSYYIHFRTGDKQVWEKVGPKPQDAVNRAEIAEVSLKAKAMGIVVQNPETPSLGISASVYAYLQEYELSHGGESYSLMKQTLDEFVDWVKKRDVSAITRVDMLRYKKWLIDRRRSDRTAGNKMLRVNQWYRWAMKLEPGKGLVTVKDAKYVETEPEVYDQDDLDKFFAACNPFHLRVFKTLLWAGLRKQEMEYLEWTDLSYTAGTIKVQAHDGFRPKTWEERTIEVPDDILAMLKATPLKGKYVFGTKGGNRYTHVWDDCKEIAEKAKVENFHPHKFRATYATHLLQQGFDLKTVQKLLGHKNLESTMRYLAKAQSHTVRAKVNAVFAGS